MMKIMRNHGDFAHGKKLPAPRMPFPIQTLLSVPEFHRIGAPK